MTAAGRPAARIAPDAGAAAERAAIRRTVLARDGSRCVECGAATGDLHLHHLVPRAFGGTDAADNLVTLCAGCHAARHPNLQAGLGRRFVERWAWRLARLLDRDLPPGTGGEQLGHAMRILGVDRLRPGQLDAILAALRGESVLLVSPTGSGKSLCFQLPALLRSGTTIVVSPLKALMSDQVRGLHRRRIPATFINGDLAPDEKRSRYALLGGGALRLLFCAPERFDRRRVDPAEATVLEAARPPFLVVDEAHCIDRWGDAFRPSYGRLGEVRARLGRPPVLAFTATAGPATRHRILEALAVPDARVILHDVDRPEVALLRLDVAGGRARAAMVARALAALRKAGGGRTLVFAPTIRKVEEIADLLLEEGIEAALFHGQLRPAVRDHVLGRFTGRLGPAADIVVCTGAFGMGIDVPDIRLVFHWQHPAGVEDYLQETGRAGRDRRPSLAVLFRGADDLATPVRLLDRTLGAGTLPDDERAAVRAAKMASITEMSRLARLPAGCFRAALLAALGGAPPPRPGLGKRLLARVFAARPARTGGPGCCCDACAQCRGTDEAFAWGLGVIARMGGTFSAAARPPSRPARGSSRAAHRRASA